MIIKFYNGSKKRKMARGCRGCGKPIGIKPCVLITNEKGVYLWYCESCVIVKGFYDWVR